VSGMKFMPRTKKILIYYHFLSKYDVSLWTRDNMCLV